MSEDPALNPMHWAHRAPRCRARSKHTGQPCRSPSVRGWGVCRIHGAGGGAPEGARNGRYRTGLFTAEAVETRRALAAVLREVRQALASLKEKGT